MERALSIELLSGALDDREGLPNSQELQKLLTDAEIQLLSGQGAVSDTLIETGWYLLAVASVSEARQRYTLARQRQAFQVAAHIFDLALNREDLDSRQRLSIGFGCAVGFHRCGQGPNASAVARRLLPSARPEVDSFDDIDSMVLSIGIATLSLDLRLMSRWLHGWKQRLRELSEASGLANLRGTIYGPVQYLLGAIDEISKYLTRGGAEHLDLAIAQLSTASNGGAGGSSLNSQWVAAQLLVFAREVSDGSLWNTLVLPASVPDSVRHAFTLSTPPVLTLWEPQVALLKSRPDPFSADVNRLVMSVPTSGGKTLLAQLLAIEEVERTGSSVCFVTPSRSLAREIRIGLAPRLRVLGKRLGAERPDFVFGWANGELDLGLSEEPSIEVMTPESLSNLVRRDPESVLDKYSMFIFDEAQLITQGSRGLILEGLITTLSNLTERSSHRIALMSAAMGNHSAIASWLDSRSAPLVFHSEWRGPRRLHAVFNSVADWSERTKEVRQNSAWPYRYKTKLNGQLRVLVNNGEFEVVPVRGVTSWNLSQQAKGPSVYDPSMRKDSKESTPQYVIAGEMISSLGNVGGLLAVANTRGDAQNLARGIALCQPESGVSVGLYSFVEEQLGPDHALVHCLRKGVGFHHAGLPLEVLEALESAMRSGILRYLTCTSTLTDGVNLPVRTVIIYDQSRDSTRAGGPLRGPRLVNAIGRAGRAGKETEGWVILIRTAVPSAADFEILNPSPEDLAVQSVLVEPGGFDWIDDLDDPRSIVWESWVQEHGTSSDFVGFVWGYLATLELLGREPHQVEIAEVVQSTLGYHQSGSVLRGRLEEVASIVQREFIDTDPISRGNWARTGMSIPSARILENCAGDIVASIAARGETLGDLWDPIVALELFESAIVTIYALPESPAWLFRKSRSGAPVEVPVVALASAWLAGENLPTLANRFLADVPRLDFRIEQMVDAVSRHFEHYLSWTLGALVEMVNAIQHDGGADETICSEMGGYIRYGVQSPLALELMLSGVRSRRLASLLAGLVFHGSGAGVEVVRGFLSSMTFAQWRDSFEPTPSEIVDLLELTREPRGSMLRDLVESGSVSCVLDPEMLNFVYSGISSEARLIIHRVEERLEPHPLGVYDDAQLLGTVLPKDHSDVESIVDSGLSTSVSLDLMGADVMLTLRLID